MAIYSEVMLRQAVEFAAALAKASSQKGVHEQYFDPKVIKLQRFRQVLKKSSEVLTAHDGTKEAFVKFFRENRPSTDEYYSLYKAILQVMDLKQQQAADQYIGSYTCYRKSDNPERLIVGEIEIGRNAEYDYHFFSHVSEQPIGDRNKKFSHRGPVYVLSNRLYLVGIGREDPASYVRPIILKAVDDPTKQELVGMLLTETNDNVPLASKTVLLHSEYKRVLSDEYRNQASFDAHIHKLLMNQSIAQPHIIHGWSKA